MNPVLKACGITKSYDENSHVLKGISLEIPANSFTAILGPSGCGKSTLLNILSGLIRPSSGSVTCQGTVITDLSGARLADWRRSVSGNIFQDYLLLNNLNVRENIETGMPPEGAALPFDRLVRFLEIDTLLDKFPAQLSGGQQQRTAIARAVIKKPLLLFCDEATGALDEANSKKVVSLLHSLRETYGITVLFVTHNLEIARTADRVITLRDGMIVKDQVNVRPIAADEMVWD